MVGGRSFGVPARKATKTNEQMANCLLDTAFAGVACADRGTPGSYDEIWIGNREELTVTKGTTSDEGLLTDITFDSGTGWYRFKCKKNSVVPSETLNGGEEDLISYQQQVEFHIASVSQAARNAIDALGGPDLVVVVRTKGDVFKVIGTDGGARMVENEETAAADGFGNRVVIRADEEPTKMYQYLDTDTATTVAALASATVAS